MACISLTDVTVRLPVVTSSAQRSLFSTAARTAARGATLGRLARGAHGPTYVEALRNITLDLRDGDRLALIGRNGAGKSTLLRTMAQIFSPSSGEVRIEGDISLLFNYGSALEFDQSGVENLDYIGRILGLDAAARRAFISDVADFSELAEFMDMPVRTYSAGMLIRLLFGAITAMASDILLVDEVIGAGDAHFIAKAKKRALEAFERGKIVVVASHQPEILFDLCNRAVWVDGGRIVDAGDPKEVWDRYIAATV